MELKEIWAVVVIIVVIVTAGLMNSWELGLL